MTDPIATLKRLASKPSTKMSWTFHLAISALPLVWVALMGIYGLYVYVRLGHWPHPMVEAGPRDMLAWFLDTITRVLLLVNFFTFSVWIVLSLWQWKHYTLRQNLGQFGLYMMGIWVCTIFIWANPASFFDWWLD